MRFIPRFITLLISYFKPVYFYTQGGRDFYYRSKNGSSGYLIYMKNIKYYDTSGQDNHEWNFKFIGIYSANLTTVQDLLKQQRITFFDYNIEERGWRGYL